MGLIKDKKDIKHYQGKKYSKEELEILVKYSRYKTVYELAELLPNRTVSAIRKKCTQMGLSYHLKSEDCELFT